MVIRLRRVRYIAGRVLLCGTAFGAIRGAAALIPLMQSVQIGTNQLDSIADTNIINTSSEHWMQYHFAEGIGISTNSAVTVESTTNNDSAVISWESDTSKAMWQSKLYPTEKTANDGNVVEKHYGKQAGTQFISLEKAGQVRNCTSWKNADLLAESKILPNLPLKMDGSPMVLIYHTHTTESFERTERSFFDAAFNYRTTEPDKNMVMVGDAIAKSLANAGIGVIHAGEIHDFPVWNNSYSRSAKTVKEILAKYPSICIALDVHRDAITANSTIYAPTAVINGKKSAQIMIISGCDDGTMGMPNYRENFHFASFLQQQAEEMYSGFTRPVLFDYRKYNQDLTTGSLLVEFGSQGNTMEEARYAGELFGNALAESIKQLTK